MGDRALYIRDLFMTTDSDARLKKLRFRAWRRGFREADLILGPFADKHVSAMSAAELDTFEVLLEVPDQGHAPRLVEDDVIGRIAAFAAACDSSPTP